MVINVENSPTKVQCLNFDSLAMTTRASASGNVIVFVWSEEKWRQWNKGPFGASIKIMLEEQLVDPPNDYIESENVQ